MLFHALMVLLGPVFDAVSHLPSFDPDALQVPDQVRYAIAFAALVIPLEPIFTVLALLGPAYLVFLTYKAVVFIYNLLPMVR